MGQFLLHPLLLNCSAHSSCMIFPQHVSHMWSSPNRVSAPRQIEQMSPSLLSSSSTARAGAAALSPSDIKLAIVLRRSWGGSDLYRGVFELLAGQIPVQLQF